MPPINQPGTVASSGPNTPQEFYLPTPPPQATPILDDGNEWWGGVQLCFATMALAATVAITAQTTVASQQFQNDPQDPAGSLLDGNPGPDSPWVPPTVVQPLDLGYQYSPDEVPTITFHPDEDYWLNPAGPLVYAPWLAMQQMFFGAGEPNTIEEIATDEDLWQNPTPPVLLTFLWPQQFAFDSSEILPRFDEDFWQNWVAPVPWTLFQRLPYLPDTEESIFVFQAPTVDEDYWQNPIAPVPWTFGKLYLPEPEELPAGSLFGQPDEDFWANPTAPVPLTFAWPQPFSFDTPDYTFFPDEDYWQNPTPPVALTLAWPQQWPFDVQEPGGSLHGQPDEDYWQNPTTPVPLTFLWPQQWPFDNQEKVAIQAEEDYWVNQFLPAPVPLSFALLQQWPFDQQEPAGSLHGQPDEDFWQNPVAPVPPSVKNFLYLPDPEEIPAGSLKVFATPDEDYWQNPAAPVPLTLAWPQPFSFDPSDIFPTVFVHEEDYWQNPVAAVPLTFLWPQQFGFAAGEETTERIGVDEDYWQNPVAPVPLTFRALYLPDPSDEVATPPPPFHPDEDYWPQQVAPVNQVPPTPAALFRLLPYLPDPEEIPAGSLVVFIGLDQEIWINNVIPSLVPPVPGSMYQFLPLMPDFDGDLPAGSMHPVVGPYIFSIHVKPN
jgi:hypothetical protein